MKLYTEEQVREMMQDSFNFGDKAIDYAVSRMTPIELPSEKEIAEKIASTIDASEYGKLVYAGALWMLDQIKQQSNGKDN